MYRKTTPAPEPDWLMHQTRTCPPGGVNEALNPLSVSSHTQSGEKAASQYTRKPQEAGWPWVVLRG